MSGVEGSLSPPMPPTTTSAVSGPREVLSRQWRASSSQSAPLTAQPKRM